MLDWNVLVDVRQHSFSPAYLLLEEFGTVYQSDFENILLLKVDSIPEFIEAFNQRLVQDPGLTELSNRVVPVTSTFSFQTQAEFETKAQKVVLEWLPMLEGKKFYVRMHRMGFKDRIDRHAEETFLDLIILQHLEKIGKPGTISGIDPDVVVSVETISDRAGLSFWTRQDLAKYPWLKLVEAYC
jgi:tRNA(Ser,Leu) C12 N-acetylase TAN1